MELTVILFLICIYKFGCVVIYAEEENAKF